ncbi:MAG: hypothetical protein ACE5JQ_01500 [Candidatus Methylomirabilales bacterium]
MYALIVIVLLLVLLGAYIRLVVHAFKKSSTWGVAVFALSPITPVIYGIKFWNEVKTPFLVFSISFVLLMFVAPQLMFTDAGVDLLFTEPGIEQPRSRRAPMRVKRPSPQRVVARVPEEAAALENLVSRGRPIVVPDAGSEGPRYKVISPAEAKDYIGASVIFTGRDDRERKGKLIGVSGDRLRFERRVSRGRISFKYKAGDIKSLKVLLD